MEQLTPILQVVIALGIVNVWIIRPGKATPYRGGGASSMKEEFAAYGLSEGAMKLIGTLKLACAAGLLVGLAVPGVARPAALALAILMLGALVMHLKVKDPPARSLPAALMLAMCLLVATG